MHARRRRKPSRPIVAAFVLGVALSGFFDGILLHQVLQWHHLLSLVPGEAYRDPRVQVFADGMFHVLMYVLALVGLALLWRARRELSDPGATLALIAAFVAGFGAWNVVDVGLFHWILRIHHIRLDVDQPLAWDIGWLVGLGIAPLVLARLIAGRAGGPSGGPVAASLLAILTLGAGTLAMRPVEGAQTAVLFQPGAAFEDKLRALDRVDGRIVDMDPSGSLWVVALPEGANPWRLYLHGALVVGGTAAGGCVGALAPARTA